MKKIISLLLVFALVLSFALTLASCNGQQNDDEGATTEVTTKPEVTTEPEETEEEEEEETEEEEEKTTKSEETTEPETTTELEVTTEPDVTTEPELTTEPDVTTDPEEPGTIIGADDLHDFGDIAFIWLAGWEIEAYDGMVYMTNATTGGNISVMTEVATGMYENMTLEMYNTVYRPIYDEIGFNVINVEIEDITNDNGLKLTLIKQLFEIEGIEVSIDQIVVTVGNYSYVFSLTLAEEEESNKLIDSIDYKNSTPPVGAAAAGDLIIGDLSITYGEGWFVSEDEFMSVIGYEENRIVISLLDAEPGSSDYYDNFDLQKYEEEYKPMYEEMGYGIESVTVEQIEKNDLTFLVIDQQFAIGDFAMHMKEYILVVDEFAYNLSFVNVDEAIETAMVETIRIVK